MKTSLNLILDESSHSHQDSFTPASSAALTPGLALGEEEWQKGLSMDENENRHLSQAQEWFSHVSFGV